jgi:hypothetical protein
VIHKGCLVDRAEKCRKLTEEENVRKKGAEMHRIQENKYIGNQKLESLRGAWKDN